MKTLIINDLARTCELGREDMACVRGGHNAGSTKAGGHMGGYGGGASFMPYPMPSSPPSITATQDLRQGQNVLNETADGSAFISGVSATNTTSQFGQNNLLVV